MEFPTSDDVFAKLVIDGRCKPPTRNRAVLAELQPLKLEKPLTVSDILDDLKAIDTAGSA